MLPQRNCNQRYAIMLYLLLVPSENRKQYSLVFNRLTKLFQIFNLACMKVNRGDQRRVGGCV